MLRDRKYYSPPCKVELLGLPGTQDLYTPVLKSLLIISFYLYITKFTTISVILSIWILSHTFKIWRQSEQKIPQ